jgi:hypothetical protein
MTKEETTDLAIEGCIRVALGVCWMEREEDVLSGKGRGSMDGRPLGCIWKAV